MTSKTDNEIVAKQTAKLGSNASETNDKSTPVKSVETKAKEINGPKGLEPTRYGDWESKGRCYDF